MKKDIDKQVLYNGRWVDKEHFAVFVFNSTGQKLVKTYDEYQDLITSGVWFSSKEDLVQHNEEAAKIADNEDNIVAMKPKGGKNGRTPSIG